MFIHFEEVNYVISLHFLWYFRSSQRCKLCFESSGL